jgi:hypothetical protein
MKNKFAVWVLLVSCTVLCGTAFAHHGNVAYDEAHLITQKNVTVTGFIWANPHSIIQYDVTDDKGTVVHWAAELGSPSANTINGWTRTTVRPGDTITMYMHQSKTGTPVGRLTRITLADGKSLCDHGCTPGDKNQGY